MATANLGRVGFVNKGTYSGATAYKVNDVVTYNTGTYACIQANTGQAPTNTSYWQNWVVDNAVHKTGDETIAGVKTFSSSIASQSITIGTGGNYSAGSIFSNNDFGMVFRAKQPSPSAAEFLWANSNGEGLFSFNGTALTTNITGNAQTATSLLGDETNWASYRSRSVANMLGWKIHGNGHCIFDASQGTSPTGSAVNNTNSQSPWNATFPTLMGWNGGQTYGVRVDSARVSDSTTYASAFTTAVGSAPSYACRAWVNFNGTGTVAIRASGNVSSITDNGAGDHTINFTTAMPDVNYAPVGNMGDNIITPGNYVAISSRFNSFTVSSVRVSQSSNTRDDAPYSMVAIFR